jgi:hypothetical protein
MTCQLAQKAKQKRLCTQSSHGIAIRAEHVLILIAIHLTTVDNQSPASVPAFLSLPPSLRLRRSPLQDGRLADSPSQGLSNNSFPSHA